MFKRWTLLRSRAVCLTILPGRSATASRIAASLAVALPLACGIVASAVLRHRAKAERDAAIDELSVPADEFLALSPDVAKINVLLKPSRATYRIIQIADCHYFSREVYRRLTDEPSEEGYTEYARQVEQLQAAQLRLLCWLVDDHGLREVFLEGLSEEMPPQVEEQLKRRRKWRESRSRVAEVASSLRRQINDAEAEGKDATVLRARERQAQKYLAWGLSGGCGWDLPIIRRCVRLLPPEDRAACDKFRKARFMRPSSPELQEREAAIVRNLLSRSKCAVIVLGAGHDLSTQVERLSGGRCEYVRVIPKGFEEALECLPTQCRQRWRAEGCIPPGGF